jgi:hypothetical protein
MDRRRPQLHLWHIGGLTGVRLARLRYGIWAAAEGTVYEDSWDRARNIVDRFPIPRDWPSYLAVSTSVLLIPSCACGQLSILTDACIIYRQIYKTRRLLRIMRKRSPLLQVGFICSPKIIQSIRTVLLIGLIHCHEILSATMTRKTAPRWSDT